MLHKNEILEKKKLYLSNRLELINNSSEVSGINEAISKLI